MAACSQGSTGTSNTGSTPAGACVPGTNVVNGVNTIKFCGTATGKVAISGQTYTFSEGACFNTQGQVGVNIGHEVLDPTNGDVGNALKKQYDYLGALAQATKDGTYDHATIAGYAHGIDFTAVGTLTLSNNLQAGSFTGTTILTHLAVTGSFACA